MPCGSHTKRVCQTKETDSESKRARIALQKGLFWNNF